MSTSLPTAHVYVNDSRSSLITQWVEIHTSKYHSERLMGVQVGGLMEDQGGKKSQETAEDKLRGGHDYLQL